MNSDPKENLKFDKLKSIVILSTILIVVIIFLVWFIKLGHEPEKFKFEDQKASVAPDGSVPMKKVPVEEQIQDIKSSNKSITNCTSDEESIICTDESGQQQNFSRDSVQDFVY